MTAADDARVERLLAKVGALGIELRRANQRIVALEDALEATRDVIREAVTLLTQDQEPPPEGTGHEPRGNP